MLIAAVPDISQHVTLEPNNPTSQTCWKGSSLARKFEQHMKNFAMKILSILNIYYYFLWNCHYIVSH